MEKLFLKLAVGNRILKNDLLGFSNISSSSAPDRALLGDGLVRCG